MEKINIAEILKDCPSGMKLDCTMFEDVYFDCIDDVCDIIKCYIQDSKHKIGISFDRYGCYTNLGKSKCVIFPKGKTTWEGFQRPFKDGDIVATDNGRWLGIIKNKYDIEYHTVHCAIDYTFNATFYRDGQYCFSRFATEEEKQKLFDAIKDNGYKWNAKTKTLEKLIIPKFKAGDKIEKCRYSFTITEVKEDYYLTKGGDKIPIEYQDDFNLISDKFNINTLKPFDKVLVRDTNNEKWKPALWGFYDIDNAMNYPYECYGTAFAQCIPYEGNEHLRGKTDDCSSFFKTWEK